MPTSTSSLRGASVRDAIAPDTTTDPRTTRAARAIVTTALVLGLLADLLFHDYGPTGFAFPLWIGVLALATVSLTWTADRTLPREAGIWLGSALVFSCCAAWRDSPALMAFNTLAVLGSLGFAAIALDAPGASVFAARLRDTVWAVLSLVRTTAQGIFPVALRDAFPPGTRRQSQPTLQAVVRAVAIAAPLIIVFGSLLLSADPVFASLAPSIDLGTALSHLVIVGFFAWIVGGWAAGALLNRPAWNAPDGVPFTLGVLDVTIVLGTLDALFTIFVFAQFGSFFGGEAFVRARTGLSLAGYARTGFFQLVWTALLVVPVLVASRAALRPGPDVTRRHTVLAAPMILLVLTMLASAASRLGLYVHYFGLTTDRLYPAVFMVWLAVVLVWLGATVLRDWGRPFVAGATVTGLVALGALNVANPDVIVARVNTGRAFPTAAGVAVPVDLRYLAGLSGDAIGLVADGVLAAPRLRVTDDAAVCAAANRLIENWAPTSRRANRVDQPAAWRHATLGELRGLRAIAERTPALRAVRRASCAAAHR